MFERNTQSTKISVIITIEPVSRDKARCVLSSIISFILFVLGRVFFLGTRSLHWRIAQIVTPIHKFDQGDKNGLSINKMEKEKREDIKTG